MAQAKRSRRACNGRVDGYRPVIDFVGGELDTLTGAELLLGLGQPRKELADDNAIPDIGIVVRTGSLGVLHEVMTELSIKHVVITEQRDQWKKCQRAQLPHD